MKTKFFTLLAFTVLGLLVGFTETKAQISNSPGLGKIAIREYPNPAFENAIIETTLPTATESDAIITITNMQGQEMYKTTCTGCGGVTTRTVSVKLWPAGMYNYTMVFKNRAYSSKFIVFN